MTDLNPNPPEARPLVPRRRPFVIQVLIVLGCVVILTGGAIFGAAATCHIDSSHNSRWAKMFAWSAVTGLAIIVLCVLFIAAWGVWMIVKKIREN